MKRLSLLTLTIIITLGCQRSEANPIDATRPAGMENESSQLTRLTSCYDADEWTCEVEAAIVRLTNEKRASADLEQIFESSYVARGHSKGMVIEGVSHKNFESRGNAILKAVPGLTIIGMGENVAMMSQSIEDSEDVAAEFVRMWWNSDGHRRNMVGDYSYIGVGVVRSAKGIYATQIFIKPSK